MTVKSRKDIKLGDLPGKYGNGEGVIFKKGKDYEVIPVPTKGMTGLEDVTIVAKGEDGKFHEIFSDEVHYQKTKFALENFDFRSLEEEINKELV